MAMPGQGIRRPKREDKEIDTILLVSYNKTPADKCLTHYGGIGNIL
jgi:hypothetical protein